MMNSNVQAAMPKFAGLSHVCIFVDDMMEAVDYYQKLLGVVPDHYLSHWRNEGFFKAGGFVKEAADGDVSIAFVNVPGTKLTLELMQYHSPEGRKEPGETYPDEVHFFDQDMKKMDERKQESVCVTCVVRRDSCFLFILLFFLYQATLFIECNAW